MHSDWTIWDFFKANSSSLTTGESGVFSFLFSDPYSVNYIREEIPKTVKSNLITLTGKDLTVEWIEDNFESLSLFGNVDSYYILEAQDIKKEVQHKLLSIADFINDRALILIFMKENDCYSKLKKINTVTSVKFNPPKFWEWDKLFNFLTKRLDLNFDSNAKMVFMDMVNQDFGDYLKYLNMLSLEYGNDKITLEKLKSIVSDERFNKFQLCEVFIEKEFLKFFETLITVKPSYSELLELFIFIQSTLIKVFDPAAIETKDYKTKFDKKILAVKNIWNQDIIKRTLSLLSDLETRAKTKDPMMYQYLKTLYNRSFH